MSALLVRSTDEEVLWLALHFLSLCACGVPEALRDVVRGLASHASEQVRICAYLTVSCLCVISHNFFSRSAVGLLSCRFEG